MTDLHHLLACSVIAILCLATSFWMRSHRAKLYLLACERAGFWHDRMAACRNHDEGGRYYQRSLKYQSVADRHMRARFLELAALVIGSISAGFAVRLAVEVLRHG